ncbi:SDR family oxidoreductase [Nordella sp. HKS 07]|uniref:SDR family oxidoreductase n=1 Tax=Nordella sp. HKS 07 TaxID=2712222 RepID=UPI0013E11456|nr:SDR family oxidoreductase [Nordella sp. HKS 07]QIG48634.1 SDR family oxidoreductase [Nordella sp. HKS 07]
MPHLFCFGLGFTGQALARRLTAKGWTVTGTSRSGENGTLAFDGSTALPQSAFDGVTHLLISVPPGPQGDPVLSRHADDLRQRARQFQWAGYLSTTGVYGDRHGDWVDETSPLTPTTERGQRRLAAETQWHELGLPLHIFRLAGIYGPGRNQLVSILDGTAKRIVKQGQIFSRIHVEDIAGVLEASIARPDPERAYNVCDDEPCPPQEVVAFAAELLDRPPPPEIAFDAAALSPMAKSFYAESKRVSNKRIKQELGYRLLFPTYREGLTALLATLPS